MTTLSIRAVTPSLRHFRTDVCRGLRATPRTLPCKYFYDPAGSELFEQITRLDEYYLTRTERAIMVRHVGEIAARLGPDCLLVEYGSGTSAKTRLLLDALETPAGYVPIDVASAHLRGVAQALRAEYPEVEVLPLCADFTRHWSLPPTRRRPARVVVYFPGSTIGNFGTDEAAALLRHTAQRSDGLVLGADLHKDPALLEAAYDDAKGVTAAFNRNLLVRINRELGADFAVEQFAHRALFNAGAGRIEMHLVSRVEQTVRLDGESFRFSAGETIHTESSYKYRPQQLHALADAAGFAPVAAWTDPGGLFSVQYWQVK